MLAKMKETLIKLENSRGFTMIELAVVIAIISVLSTMAIKSFTESRIHVADAVALAETQGLGKAVLDVFLEGEDVDLTHNLGDGSRIGTLDNSGNGRKPVFQFSPGVRAEITGGSLGGSEKGICDATVTHADGSKTYYLFIDENTKVISFPSY